MTNQSMLPYHLSQNGQNYPELKMKIQRLTFDPNTGTPKRTETIGTWKAGLGGQELIEFAAKKDLQEHKAVDVYRVVVVVVCSKYLSSEFYSFADQAQNFSLSLICNSLIPHPTYVRKYHSSLVNLRSCCTKMFYLIFDSMNRLFSKVRIAQETGWRSHVSQASAST